MKAIVNIKKISRKVLKGLNPGWTLLIPVLFFSSAFKPNTSGGNEPNLTFQLSGYSFKGEMLVIKYVVPFPGMTKVRLYTSGQELVWSSQYVDDIQGEQQVQLRSSKFSHGSSYLFEFDYKGQVLKLPVVIP